MSMEERFDPQEEEGRRGSGHVTRRDVIIVSVALVLFGLLLTPVFLNMLANRHKFVCTDNLSKIVKAINLYAEDNSGRLPPAYMSDNSYSPLLTNGKVYSWASLLTPLIGKQDAFKCPAAAHEELVKNDDGRAGEFFSAYGLFMPLSAAPLDSVASPSQTVLIGETTTSGAKETYNPNPMIGDSGQPVPDGIAIGFDNSNFSPADQGNVYEASKFATRLAFYKTAKGTFELEGPTRHPGGLHFLYVDGHIDTHKPPYASIRRTGKKNGEIIDAWAMR